MRARGPSPRINDDEQDWQASYLSAKFSARSPCPRNKSGLCPHGLCWHSLAWSANSVGFQNIFKSLGGLHEIPSASRPRCGQAHRRRREDSWRHHHSGTAKEKPSQGEITAVGPGGRDENGKLIPIDLKVGDRVLFGKWSGTEVKIDGQDLLIMKESDIMGVLA